MNSTELLLTRQSSAKLTTPAPDNIALDTILKAAMRVPDHGALSPWHFTIVSGKGLQKLSEIFVAALKADGAQENQLEKAAKMPFRAPLIIVVSSRCVVHNKIPKQEQVISAACCVHAMQMAAYSLGYGGIWRTGDLAYNEKVKQSLAISKTDEIVGYLYLGTPEKQVTTKQSKHYQDYISYL
jgi:nitroreductase